MFDERADVLVVFAYPFHEFYFAIDEFLPVFPIGFQFVEDFYSETLTGGVVVTGADDLNRIWIFLRCRDFWKGRKNEISMKQ